MQRDRSEGDGLTNPNRVVGKDDGLGVTVSIASRSAGETRALAFAIGEVAAPGWVILLEGPLGAGKTVFAQGVLTGLGYRGRVASPTFTLINEYEARLTVWHADIYRLSGAEEFAAIGGDELLGGQNGVTLVEWASKLGDQTPLEAIRVHLDFVAGEAPDERRSILVSVNGSRYRDVVPVLREFGVKHLPGEPSGARRDGGGLGG